MATSEAPKVTAKGIKDFDTSIKALLHTAFEIHDKAYGSSAAHQLWMVWANKFFTAYVKSKNPDAFHGMFLGFLSEYSKEIAAPIFLEKDDETLVNDNWLRDESVKKGPGIKASIVKEKKASSGSWSPSEMSRCKGAVIYFDNDNPKFVAVSIPLSDIYRQAVKLYKDKGDKDPSYSILPGKILLYFYSILHNVVSDAHPDKELITKNVKQLATFIEQLTPTEGTTSESSGAGFAGISKVMAQVMKSAGMDTSGISENGINSMLGNALNEKAVAGMGKVVGEVIKAVQGATSDTKATGPQGISEVLGNLGKALQTDSVKNAVVETATAAQQQSAALEASIPTAASVATTFGDAVASTGLASKAAVASVASTVVGAYSEAPVAGSAILPLPGQAPVFNPGQQE
ncbi:Hypothetical protein POVN_LOCUS441 [uncultured virus]|nr:Hypothetical protein POVN_LOCUS441 [uncultured virus]